MLTHTMYFRLKGFERFWEQELSKQKVDRVKRPKYNQKEFEFHQRNMIRIGEYLMAKKAAKTPKFEWKGYVNINIPEREVEALEIFASDEKTVYFEYNALLMTGYQIKMYFDDYSESIKCVAVCHNPDDPNYGYAASAFAEDWFTALAVLLYKHLKIADRDWDNASSKTMKKFG